MVPLDQQPEQRRRPRIHAAKRDELRDGKWTIGLVVPHSAGVRTARIQHATPRSRGIDRDRLQYDILTDTLRYAVWRRKVAGMLHAYHRTCRRGWWLLRHAPERAPRPPGQQPLCQPRRV